jgi:hypothetical protein
MWRHDPPAEAGVDALGVVRWRSIVEHEQEGVAMTVPYQAPGRLDGGVAIDPRWWSDGEIEGRRMPEVLASRDVGAVFRFLRGMGFSLTSLCRVTALSESRVRAVLHGAQRITSYEVLERVALGLRIPRGAMGLAYTTDAYTTDNYSADPYSADVRAADMSGRASASR